MNRHEKFVNELRNVYFKEFSVDLNARKSKKQAEDDKIAIDLSTKFDELFGDTE